VVQPSDKGNEQVKQSSPERSLVQLSPEEAYSLQKLQIQSELQDDLLKWAQTRFWIIAVVSVLVCVFGVRAFVREMVASELRDAVRASSDAQAAAGQGRDAVKEVRSEAAKYRDLVQELTTAAADVEKQLKELRSRIDAEGARTVAASDLKISALDQQVSELATIVSRLAQKSQDTREVAQDSEKRVALVREEAASKQAAFQANSDFSVVVVHHGPSSKTESIARDIVNALSKAGFKASEGSWAEGIPVHDNIQIDYRREADEKAALVHSIVTEILRSRAYPAKAELDKKPRFFAGDRDIRVFM
jgi:hypothetical protein